MALLAQPPFEKHKDILEEKFIVLHVKPYNKDIYNHSYDKRLSPESWSLKLTSPLAENNGGACALRQSGEKYNKCSF